MESCEEFDKYVEEIEVCEWLHSFFIDLL